MLSSLHNGNLTRRSAVVYAPSFFRSDEALLSALRQGHRGARAVFFERYSQDVEELLLRLLGSYEFDDLERSSGDSVEPADALPETLRHMVQRVFLSALRVLPKYRGDAALLRSWLLHLTVSESVKVLRRRRARPKALLGNSLRKLRRLSGMRVASAAAASRRAFVGGGGSRRRSEEESAEPQCAEAEPMVAAAGGPSLTLLVTQRMGMLEPGVIGDASPRLAPELQLYAVLDQLPVQARVAFCLHYIAQFDIGEVASLCELSMSAARRAVHRGRDEFSRLAQLEPELAAWV